MVKNKVKVFSWGYALIIALFVASFIGVIPQMLRSETKIEKIKEEIAYLETKNALELEKIKKYTENIEQLDNDYEKERIARNHLQMLKEHEVIYRLNSSK